MLKYIHFFYIYSVRVEALKEFSNAADTEYKKLLGYSKTRWLTLMPALERVLKMFQPLKNYFPSIDKCPNILKEFFENPSSELWLYFMHAQSATFHQAVLNIESQYVSAIDAANEINQLQSNLNQKQNVCYLPHTTRNIMAKLQDTGVVNEKNVKTAAAVVFYKTSKEHSEQWCQFNEEVKLFEWANLRKVPSWEEVQKVMDLLIEQKFISGSQDTGVFDEFSPISNYTTAQKISDWNTGNIATENRWVEVFTHFNANDLSHVNFCIIVEYILCLPGSNAPVERVFSRTNKIWSSEKT